MTGDLASGNVGTGTTPSALTSDESGAGFYSFNPPDVLVNDISADNQPLTVVAYTEPTHGSLLLNPDGTFDYTPLAGFVGADTFTHTVDDSGTQATGTVTINVTDQAPTATNLTYQVLHNHTLYGGFASPSLLSGVPMLTAILSPSSPIPNHNRVSDTARHCGRQNYSGGRPDRYFLD